MSNKIGDNIALKRKEKGWTQEELAKRMGYKSKSTINKIELGINDIPQSKVVKFATILGTTPAELMGWTESRISASSHNPVKGVRINVLGRVAAGIPIDAVEEIIDTEEITDDLAKTGVFFGLQIHGDSMEPKFSEGDVVIVRQQDDAETGDIVIATVNGSDATCKRLKKYETGIALLSTNPNYDPMIFSNQEILEKPVRIIGKVVELRAKF